MILLFGAEFTQTWALRKGGGIEPKPGARRMVDETPGDPDIHAAQARGHARGDGGSKKKKGASGKTDGASTAAPDPVAADLSNRPRPFLEARRREKAEEDARRRTE